MADKFEWNWQDWGKGNAPDGARLLLKMQDSAGRITYAIGRIDQGQGEAKKAGELILVAKEVENPGEPLFWTLIVG